MASKTLLTAADLERMPDDDSARHELIEGELITMPPAAEDHGYDELKLASTLYVFVRKHKLGRVYPGDTGFRLSPDTVLSPDVAFVRKERVAQIRSKSYANGAPDLAVEILSPSNSAAEMVRKVRLYLSSGCHTVWLVDRDRREVHVFEASRPDRRLRVGDVLDAPELLPGFSIPIVELFED